MAQTTRLIQLLVSILISGISIVTILTLIFGKPHKSSITDSNQTLSANETTQDSNFSNFTKMSTHQVSIITDRSSEISTATSSSTVITTQKINTTTTSSTTVTTQKTSTTTTPTTTVTVQTTSTTTTSTSTTTVTTQKTSTTTTSTTTVTTQKTSTTTTSTTTIDNGFVVVIAPFWEGTYSVIRGCNVSTCCCPTGSIVLSSNANEDYLEIQTSLGGQCSGQTLMQTSTVYPNAYTWTYSYFTFNFEFTINGDSSMLSGGVAGATGCSVEAQRI